MHQIWYGNASDGNPVDVVESFTFLGSIQTSDGYCKPDIACQIVSRSRQCRHSITSGMLNIFLFRRKVVFIKHWLTLVLSILLYTSETWTSVASDMKAVESFLMKCQRRILENRWHDFVRNSEVSLRTGLTPVSDRITRGRNAIFGHVARLPDNTPAHQAMLHQVELLAIGRSTPRPFMETSTRSTTISGHGYSLKETI